MLALVLALFVSGCDVAEVLFTCPDCALKPDEAAFQSQDEDGILAFGLTVDAPTTLDDPVTGSIEWLAAAGDDVTLRELTFPSDLLPGQHRLILWRVPAGTWSLRNARVGEGRQSRLSKVLVDQTAATVVRAGHITIAGEIRVKATSVPPIMSYGLEASFVRKELQAYPDITAPSDEMPLVDLRAHPTLNKHPSSH